jgi:HrpA-like RNA helicase
MTKIVISTNITETSVTVNDISVVIDCGTHKEMQYDVHAGMSCLVETRLSKANASQRAGRAGRVRKGTAYHL